MKILGFILVACFVFLGSLHGEPAAPLTPTLDPTGTWEWTTKSPTGEIPTTLKLAWQDNKVSGFYSNQFGNTAISNLSLEDDVISFDVVRDFGGQKYVVKYHGKMQGDTISGTIEAPGHDGGETVKLDWNAKRTTNKKASDAKPKG